MSATRIRSRIVRFTRIGLHTDVEDLPVTLTVTWQEVGGMWKAKDPTFTEQIITHAEGYLLIPAGLSVDGHPDREHGTLHQGEEQVGEFTVHLP